MNETIKDSPEFDDTATSIFEGRVKDINGWFVESFTEADDGALAALAYLIIELRNKPADKHHDLELRIGKQITAMVADYCEPEDVEVMEAMQ